MFGDEGLDVMKFYYGQNLVHVPMWMIAQDQGDTTVFVGATRNDDIRYKSKMTHQLILGEMFIRPHVVSESEHLKGSGISAIARSGADMESWVNHGNIILDPMGKFR